MFKLEGGEEFLPEGSSECDPVVGDGPPTHQAFNIEPGLPPPSVCTCDYDEVTGCCINNGKFSTPERCGGDCCCIFWADPPYVNYIEYELTLESIDDGIEFGGIFIPTMFYGMDVWTDAGDIFIDHLAQDPMEFSPGVTRFILLDIPLLLDYDTFEADVVPVGIWVNDTEYGVHFTMRADTTAVITSIASDTYGPTAVMMFGPMPNPSKRIVSLSLQLNESGFINIGVYDVAGRCVRSLHQGVLEAGPHVFDWDAKNEAGLRVASGTYIYRLEMNGQTQTKKVMILK